MKMKYILIILLLAWAPLFAQDLMIVPQVRFVRFAPVYQYWNYADGYNFSQITFPVYAYANINSNASVNLRTNQANVSGNSITDLAGFTDTQLGFNYHYRDWNTVFSLGLNIPSGIRELDAAEYSTSYLMSLNYFNLMVPNFGQGFNAAPGVNWAYKMNENFILGVAAMFQYKGGFKPIEGMTAPYEPGNEISASIGGDYNISETQVLSTDVMYTHYGSDAYDGAEVFASGDKIVVNLMYQQYLDFNKLSFTFRYRSKAKNSVAGINGDLVEESAKSIPDQFEVNGSFRQRLNSDFYLGYNVRYRWFQSTPVYYGAYLLGAALSPEYRATQHLQLLGQARFSFGSFEDGTGLSGFLVTAGMQYQF